jgi:hypothetical protein
MDGTGRDGTGRALWVQDGRIEFNGDAAGIPDLKKMIEEYCSPSAGTRAHMRMQAHTRLCVHARAAHVRHERSEQSGPDTPSACAGTRP